MSQELNFLETDAGRIYDLVLSSLEDRVKEPLYPGDERRLFGEAFVAVVVALFHTVNDQCRQSLLRYARGSVLDAMGERVNTPRHGPAPAAATLRFSVPLPTDSAILIPAGTRATADAAVYFETTEPAVLEAGAIQADVPARATTGGSLGNGFRPGSVNTLVDLIPRISAVENLEETRGGDDGEPYDEEGDGRYRERIRLAPAGFSTAGPEAAYRHFALAADPRLRDVRIVSDQMAGAVDIVALMENGNGPDPEMTARILAAANDSAVRPMNDLVSVVSPDFREYDLDLTYYVSAASEAAALEALEGEGGALERYVAWQDGAIGRDINPDRLRALLLCPHWGEGLTGALRVDIREPAFRRLGDREAARFSGRAAITRLAVEE